MGNFAVNTESNKRVFAERPSNIVKKLDFYNRMTNTGSSNKRCDTDSSEEGINEVDNRYGRRGNNRQGPIKPVHNRVNNENE